MSDFEIDVDSLRDPEPPAPGPPERDAVARRARGLRRRSRQRTGFVVGLCVVVVAGTIGAVVASRDSTRAAVVVAPAESTSVPARSALVVDTRCFPTTSRAPDETAGATTAVAGWPAGAPRLLVLARDGDLWVVDSGTATLWAAGAHRDPGHTGYVWARFAADGSIYASRVGAENVEIDHLTGPGVAQIATTLPFTIKDDAPAGFCPINGHLASFGISAQGFVLLKQQAGPWQHSCPAAPVSVATDPWRCQSPYMVSPEIRTDLARTGTGAGATQGGPLTPEITTIVTSQTDSNTIGTATGNDVLIETLDPDPSRGHCCSGGPGVAFALTAQARRLVYATGNSKVTDVNITGPDKIPNSSDQHLWAAHGPITSIAASSEWVAAASGNAVTTLRLDGSHVSTPIDLQSGPVVTLDWAPTP